MDAAHFAAMSDPDRNPHFRRRWTEPAPVLRTTVVISPPQDAFGAIGTALLGALREARERDQILLRERGQ